MTRYLKLWTALIFAALLAACGGGGGSAGTTATGGGGIPTDPAAVATASVADIAIYTDKASISNSGTDKVNVTVIAVNANRNAVVGAKVTVSADKNSIFTPVGDVTDVAGTYSGILTIGSDRTNRTITVTALVNGISKQTTVQVADITGPTPSANSVADFALLTSKVPTPQSSQSLRWTRTGTSYPARPCRSRPVRTRFSRPPTAEPT
jgi:hypothetical protein